MSDTLEQHARAKELSPPLYVLFRQLESLCVDQKAQIQIVDSEPLHPSLTAALSKRSRGAEADGGDDDDNLVEDEEDGNGRKRSKGSAAGDVSGGLSSSAKQEVQKLAAEPLAVLLSLRVAVGAHGEVPVFIRFQRLLHVNAILVESEGASLPADLLAHLIPGDSGADYPDPLQIQRAQYSPFPSASPARPYAWAQTLAGLVSLPETQSPRLEASTRMVFQRIHSRVRTSTILQAQLLALSSLPRAIPVLPQAEGFFPPASPLTPLLTEWQEKPCSEEMLSFFPDTALTPSAPDSDPSLNKALVGRYFLAQFNGEHSG